MTGGTFRSPFSLEKQMGRHHVVYQLERLMPDKHYT